MRMLPFIIFFSVFVSVYSLVNYYIFIHGYHTLQAFPLLKTLYVIGFWTLAASFLAGRVLERVYLSYLSDIFTWAGSFWLAAMLYFFLSVVLIDLLRLVNHLFPFYDRLMPAFIVSNPHVITIGLASAVFLLILGGHINALHPRIQRYKIAIDKQVPGREQLRIAMVSDIHVGTIISKKRVSKMVKQINELKADVILIAGDLVDEDLTPVIRQNLGEDVAQLRAPLGVYAVTGNHEYIGGAEEAVAYLQQFGVLMLRDTAVKLIEGIYVGGREDADSRRFAGKERKPLQEIRNDVPDNQVFILMDHQPKAIMEAVSQGVDLILSGHTHHGQLWPLNYITQAVFMVSRGHQQFEGTHAVVSNGIGSWGPPVRIGNRPEVVEITLEFQKH